MSSNIDYILPRSVPTTRTTKLTTSVRTKLRGGFDLGELGFFRRDRVRSLNGFGTGFEATQYGSDTSFDTTHFSSDASFDAAHIRCSTLFQMQD
jgi:hypothetical protein